MLPVFPLSSSTFFCERMAPPYFFESICAHCRLTDPRLCIWQRANATIRVSPCMSDGSTDRPSGLVVGTAGHIDHGKTSLVHALTGTNTDRLAEEKRRGISI